MIKLQIDNLIQELDLDLGGHGFNMVDYNSGVIEDVIFEIADNVFVSDFDLWNWARDNQDVVESTILEFGMDTDNLDLTRTFSMAHTLKLEQDMRNDINHIVRYWIYHNLPVDELSEDMVEYIEDYSNVIDTNQRLDWIMEEILDYMEVYHNDELK